MPHCPHGRAIAQSPPKTSHALRCARRGGDAHGLRHFGRTGGHGSTEGAIGPPFVGGTVRSICSTPHSESISAGVLCGARGSNTTPRTIIPGGGIPGNSAVGSTASRAGTQGGGTASGGTAGAGTAGGGACGGAAAFHRIDPQNANRRPSGLEAGISGGVQQGQCADRRFSRSGLLCEMECRI